MMLSFPEYFSDGTVDIQLQKLFSTLNLILALPVFFYSASVFYKSAWAGLKKKFLNIDAPIVLAIWITFARSVYEILSGTGAGYLDSMAGIVFFMLIGRYLQDRTYKKLSFERDYRSYFPIAVTVKRDKDKEVNIPVTDLKVGDRMIVRNNELIPADSILFYGDANIDYSFVTGESAPIKKSTGEIIYAGGKQKGSSIEMEVVKEVSNSYLTELWNKDVFRSYEDKKLSFIHKLSQYFTLILFSIAAITAVYWGFNDQSRILNAVSAILIIACPCALLLSATFTNGNVLRIFGQNGLYLKNATVIEMIAEADSIVFDKTGTITQNGAMKVSFSGNPLSDEQEVIIRSLSVQSTHPYSKAITYYLPKSKLLKVHNLKETAGLGLEGDIDGNLVKLGSALFTGAIDTSGINTGKVYVTINEQVVGCFTITNKYREGMEKLIHNLDKSYELSVISGDNDAEQPYLEKLFIGESTLLFNQTPEGKLKYINDLRTKHKKVMMVGDGLNDAGALRQSNIGIAVSDEVNNFSPACDAILDGTQLNRLGTFIRYAKAGKAIVVASFIISILYNFVGLSFAVQGILSPVIAAILMPASSLTIILFTMGTSSFIAKLWGMR
ncbi:putative copper-importing P-type ATPase A [compost metagenome]